MSGLSQAIMQRLQTKIGAGFIGWMLDAESAVLRTIAAKLSDFVSIKDFGAKGDGVTNDTAALQKARKASKKIFFPLGTYIFDEIDLTSQAIDDDGYTFFGASTTKCIFKASGAKQGKFLNLSTNGLLFTTYNTFKNFTLDISNLNDDQNSVAAYLNMTWGNTLEGINVIGIGNNKISLQCGSGIQGHTGVYTTNFVNCDFHGIRGKIVLIGYSLGDAVTTLKFSACSFAQMKASNVVAITNSSSIVQGSLDKFDLSAVSGFFISGSDIEGTGTYLKIGAGVNHLVSIGNETSGMSGQYISGEPETCQLMDFAGTVKFKGNAAGFTIEDQPFSVKKNTPGLMRVQFKAKGQSDHEFANDIGATYAGIGEDGSSFSDNHGSGKNTLQVMGQDKLGVKSNKMLIGTTRSAVAAAGTNGALPGQVAGYIDVLLETGEQIEIPYFKKQ